MSTYSASMVRAEHDVVARCRTAVRDSAIASGIAAAMAATSPGATSSPLWSSTISGMPPRANATTGVPQDIDSATTSPYGSSHIGVTRVAAECPTSSASSVTCR